MGRRCCATWTQSVFGNLKTTPGEVVHTLLQDSVLDSRNCCAIGRPSRRVGRRTKGRRSRSSLFAWRRIFRLFGRDAPSDHRIVRDARLRRIRSKLSPCSGKSLSRRCGRRDCSVSRSPCRRPFATAHRHRWRFRRRGSGTFAHARSSRFGHAAPCCCSAFLSVDRPRGHGRLHPHEREPLCHV